MPAVGGRRTNRGAVPRRSSRSQRQVRTPETGLFAESRLNALGVLQVSGAGGTNAHPQRFQIGTLRAGNQHALERPEQLGVLAALFARAGAVAGATWQP